MSETEPQGGATPESAFGPALYDAIDRSPELFAQHEGYLQLAAWTGDRRAFESLARAYYPHLLRYAKASLYGIGLACYAEDAVQGAYENVMTALDHPSFRERPLPHISFFVTTTNHWIHGQFFRAWNFRYTSRYGITMPEVKDYYYDEGPRFPHAAAGRAVVLNAYEWRDLAEEVIGRTVGAQALRDLAPHLTADEKQMIGLRYVEGLSVPETAKIMHVTPSKVKGIALRLARKAHLLEKQGVIDVPPEAHGQRIAPLRRPSSGKE